MVVGNARHRSRGRRPEAEEILMHQPCPHCDQPDMSLLRLVLIGKILRADETLLVLLADVMQACGMLPLSAEAEGPKAPRAQRQKGKLHTLRRSGADRP